VHTLKSKIPRNTLKTCDILHGRSSGQLLIIDLQKNSATHSRIAVEKARLACESAWCLSSHNIKGKDSYTRLQFASGRASYIFEEQHVSTVVAIGKSPKVIPLF